MCPTFIQHGPKWRRPLLRRAPGRHKCLLDNVVRLMQVTEHAAGKGDEPAVIAVEQ